MDDFDIEKLIAVAKKASLNSYSPYSKFKVGACLLSESGIFYSGCNVENVSYGGSICAERSAYVNAVSHGETKFLAIAIYNNDLVTPPCGICRQFMAEFGNLEIIMANDCEYKISTLNALLPDAFESF